VALLQTEQKCKELEESLEETRKKASEKTGLLQKEVEDIEGTNKLLLDEIQRLTQMEQELRQLLEEAKKKAIEGNKTNEQLMKDLESACEMYKQLQEGFSQAHASIPSDQDANVVPIYSPAIVACNAEEDDSQCASSKTLSEPSDYSDIEVNTKPLAEEFAIVETDKEGKDVSKETSAGHKHLRERDEPDEPQEKNEPYDPYKRQKLNRDESGNPGPHQPCRKRGKRQPKRGKPGNVNNDTNSGGGMVLQRDGLPVDSFEFDLNPNDEA
jgi:DNA repair exonuclease SbcCD ATPase subunit